MALTVFLMPAWSDLCLTKPRVYKHPFCPQKLEELPGAQQPGSTVELSMLIKGHKGQAGSCYRRRQRWDVRHSMSRAQWQVSVVARVYSKIYFCSRQTKTFIRKNMNTDESNISGVWKYFRNISVFVVKRLPDVTWRPTRVGQLHGGIICVSVCLCARCLIFSHTRNSRIGLNNFIHFHFFSCLFIDKVLHVD